MECDNAYNSNDDFEDREETTASRDGENLRSSSGTIVGSPHSVFTSSDSQELTASSSNKVLGHNYNGTVVFTNVPKNEAELQLYRVMQRASLLSYYDTLLEMGGDDVQQLCDAGEEEFLEIMALVGMASKPLHVRRFQKALQEWLTNPLMFQTPLPNSTSPCILPRPLSVHNVSSSPMSCSKSLTNVTPVSSPNNHPLQQLGEISSCTSAVASSPVHGSISSLSSSPCPSSPVNVQNSQPILDERQLKKLEETAAALIESLPELKPKYPNTKKKVGKELQAVLNMSENDPLRMQHIRKFSAIYGRFDCKRKAEKPLTLHEVSVNEAAAQICKHIPALLTRRDELFPLARQVVRDSGYQYSKGHSKSFAANNFTKSAPLMNTFKFHNKFNKRKNNVENPGFDEGLIGNEEKLNTLRAEIQKVTHRIEQLTNETKNISEEACEFSASKYQLEAFNRQKLQLLEEYKMLSNYGNAPKKRGRKSKQFLAFNYERSNHNEDNSTDFNVEGMENSNDSLNYEDDDTKSSEITYIQDTCSEKAENGEPESMNKEYDRIGENSDEAGRNEALDEFEEKHYKERLIADEIEKFQVVACKGDDIIAVTNPALRLCMTADTISLPGSVMLKQERTSPIEFEHKL